MATPRIASTLLALALSLAAGGCVRLNPLYRGPDYSFRTQSKDGVTNKVNEGSLDPQGSDAHAQGFRFELPAAGSLLLSVKPADAAAELEMDVYTDGQVPVASTSQQVEKKLTVQDLQPGPVFVVVHEPWRTGQATGFRLLPIFKPTDPDAAQTACKSPATARDLPADRAGVEDTVDYSAMRRTCWWRVSLAAEGGLSLRFDNGGGNISAEFVPPRGAPEKIDPAAALSKPDLPAGDYFVKVYANDAGDAGRYTLNTAFALADTCKEGGPSCAAEGAEPLGLPSDSKLGEVDFSGKQFHFYRVTLTDKGKLTINFKLLQHGPKVEAWFLRDTDDPGERLAGSTVTRDIDVPGDYFFRVEASEPGAAGKYALATLFEPQKFITADVVEVGQNPCMLTVSAGMQQNVHPGVACNVLAASGQTIEACVVDRVFTNLSEVRPIAGSCNLPAGARVAITASP